MYKTKQQKLECDCGRKYILHERRSEIRDKDPRLEIGTRDRYCSDSCWESYSSSQDTLEPCFSKKELEKLLS